MIKGAAQLSRQLRTPHGGSGQRQRTQRRFSFSLFLPTASMYEATHCTVEANILQTELENAVPHLHSLLCCRPFFLVIDLALFSCTI